MKRLGLCLLLSRSLLAQTPGAGDPLVATFNGVEIHESQLGVLDQILKLSREGYEIRRRALADLVSKKVLEMAAAEAGVSVQDYLAKEDNKISEPGEAELRGYYLAEATRYDQRPFTEVRERVLQDYKASARQVSRSALMEKLVAEVKLDVFLTPPRMAVSSTDAPRIGPAEAPVKIVEFSDFQCPFCKSAEATLKGLKAKYGEKISLAFKDFPLLGSHPEAEQAAEAARCAGDQGAFWPYHDLLFNAAPVFDRGVFVGLAGQAGLDRNAFESCYDSGKYRSRVEASLKEGKMLGVDATPSFFINGILLTGAASSKEFEALIDDELSAAR